MGAMGIGLAVGAALGVATAAVVARLLPGSAAETTTEPAAPAARELARST